MFRQFENINITDTSISIVLCENPEEEIFIEYEKKIEWMSEERIAWYGTNGEALLLGGRWLIIHKDGKEYRIYMHPEIRYTINKSIRKSGEFDLNYRKHLRAKYSRTNMDLFFVDSIDEELKGQPKFEDALKDIKKSAEAFSFGIEEKPTVIIAPSYDTDEHFISFIIIKDSQVVKQGVY